MNIKELETKANQMRKEVLTTIYEAGSGHTGSDLSCTDILVALYYDILNVAPNNSQWEDRDRYIQSKGHAAEILWTVLADKGFFSKERLKTVSQFNSELIGHPNNKVPGIEMNTGSLGHGLSLGVGTALAAKMNGKKYTTYVLMGDGEQPEGSIWEGAMAAGHYHLDNLVGIIDYNKLQITGKIEEVMNTWPLKNKYEAFGWHVVEVDGNDITQLIHALKNERADGKPTLILANTIKGKGVKAAEDQANWHHKTMNQEEYETAMKDLNQ